MYNDLFEKDIIQYSKTKDSTIFNDKLYQPLSQLFKWLCARQYKSISNSDFEDIQQQTMIRIINDIKYYKPNKGTTAISFVRMLMNQEIILRKKAIDKLNHITIEYKPNQDFRVTVNTNNTICSYIKHLQTYKLSCPKQYKKIVNVIIKALSNKSICSLSYVDKVKYIKDKSNKSIYLVRKVLTDIRKQKFYNILND